MELMAFPHGDVASVSVGLTRSEAEECVATLQSMLAEDTHGTAEHAHVHSADYMVDVAFWIIEAQDVSDPKS